MGAWSDRSASRKGNCGANAVLQYLLSPLLLWRGFLPTLLSNTLYAAGLSYYHYLK